MIALLACTQLHADLRVCLHSSCSVTADQSCWPIQAMGQSSTAPPMWPSAHDHLVAVSKTQKKGPCKGQHPDAINYFL